jgi:hypothetical protein
MSPSPWNIAVTTAGRLAYDVARAREAPPGEPLRVSAIGWAHDDLRNEGFWRRGGQLVLHEDSYEVRMGFYAAVDWSKAVDFALRHRPPPLWLDEEDE